MGLKKQEKALLVRFVQSEREKAEKGSVAGFKFSERWSAERTKVRRVGSYSEVQLLLFGICISNVKTQVKSGMRPE